MNIEDIVTQLDQEISRLQQAKALLQGSVDGNKPRSSTQSSSSAPRARVKRVLSEEARKKIAAAQRKRWANVRKAQAK